MKRIFYDIETSPNVGYFWRPGYRLQIPADNILYERAVICICWKEEGSDEVWCLTWDAKQDDSAMIAEFAEEIQAADEIVAHNGDRFDLPWIKGRCASMGVPLDPGTKTIDTLAWSKKMGFNSNRLDYLGKHLLGYGKIATGWPLWEDVVGRNDRKRLQEMVDYCVNDVILLEEVFNVLEPYHRPKTHRGVLAGGERWHCPYTGSSNVTTKKKRVTAAGTVKYQMQNKDTGQYFTINEAAHRQYLESQKQNPKLRRK